MFAIAAILMFGMFYFFNRKEKSWLPTIYFSFDRNAWAILFFAILFGMIAVYQCW